MKRILTTIIYILIGMIGGRGLVRKEWFYFVVSIALFVVFLAYEYFVEIGIKDATKGGHKWH